MPVYVLDLIGVVAIGRWLLPLQPEAQTVLRRDAGFAAAFVTNFDVIVRGDAYFSAVSRNTRVSHLRRCSVLSITVVYCRPNLNRWKICIFIHAESITLRYHSISFNPYRQ